MSTVQSAPTVSVVAGIIALAAVTFADPHPIDAQLVAGWVAALGYLVLSNVILVVTLRRRGATKFGLANLVTATRSTLVGLIAGVVAGSFVAPIPVILLVGLAVPALLLDAVDGWVARSAGSATELGARFDMEVDAFLLLALSAFVAQSVGAWVLAIGLMRYAFVAAGWILPWLRAHLPARYWRKVVTAAQGVALTVAATGVLRVIDAVLVGIALALLIESFGRDVIWLVRRRPAARGTPQPS